MDQQNAPVTRLSSKALAALPDSVTVPGYDRSRLTAGIVHVGVGGFHRVHQAMYIDRLMTAGTSHDWGICGVGLLLGDRAVQLVLQAQDCLYTLVVKHPDGTLEPRVIGSLAGYLFAPDDTEAVIEKMAAPGTRIVSLTITEGGYGLHAVTAEFDGQDPGVVADLHPGARPVTVFGLVTEALVRRRRRGSPRSPCCPATTWKATTDSPAAHSRVRPPPRPGTRRVGGPRGAFPELHGRPHHAAHHRCRPRRPCRPVRHRRRLAGGL